MNNISREFPPKAFTLIELLIVVAIIAILAAIAIPNFLEAQTRSKASRAKADMRTVATALEAYFGDYNKYPPNPDVYEGFNVSPWQLTTPIAYITSRPIDPFKKARNVSRETNPAMQKEELFYDYFCIISPEEYMKIALGGTDIFILSVDASGPLSTLANHGAFKKYGKWLQWSIGPDGQFWILEDDFNSAANPNAGLRAPAHIGWGYSFDVPYDPTNGTVSFGNIIRCQLQPEGTIPYVP